ncbi:MAG: hypothetical protein ACR2LM_00145 [Pyrinomonadaceae bacterium]
MSTESDHAREIAERIARRVSGSALSPITTAHPEVGSDLAAVRAGINELQRRLAQLEAKVSSDSTAPKEQTFKPAMATSGRQRSTPATHSPWLAGINATYSHPSEEKFGVEEATVSELVDFFEKEKVCSVEPGGKPCDHCAMCSSRGF